MLMRESQPDLSLTCIPSCGPVVHEGNVTFRVVSHAATAMRLLLYDAVGDREPSEEIEFDPKHKLGSVWQGFVKSSGHGQLYHLQADGPFDPERGLWFDGRARLIDPYAERWPGIFSLPKTASSGRRNAWSSMSVSTGAATAA